LLINFRDNFANHFSLSQEEKLLLCLAIYLHDIGCILGREKHSEKSSKLLRRKEFTFLSGIIGDDMLKCLEYIILYHSSDYDLTCIPREPLHYRVRLRLLCAIFRLLDGCELTSARTKRVLYEILKTYKKIKPKAKKFWEAHLSIVSLVFKGNDIVVDCKNIVKARVLIKHFQEELDKVNKIFKEEGFPQLNLRVKRFRLR
jgi:exopolyphosphatase/pppGpp-phosphohydrolase